MGVKQPSKNKSARLKDPPEPTKKSDKEHLTVSLRYLRPSHCISLCDAGEITSFVDKLRILTAKSWMELTMLPRHGLGYEKIARSALNVAVPAHVTDDVSIIAFRFAGLKPMVGYKDGETFHILWFDRAFDVYPH